MNIAYAEALEDLIERKRLSVLPDPPIGRLLREGVGLSQENLAALLNVDRATVSRWEAGTRAPRREHATAYADVLRRLAEELNQ